MKNNLDKGPGFILGLDLNRMFYQQVVRPLIDKHFPGLPYAVGILGEGSDVFRFDTPQSMDHNWGPHLRIFLAQDDLAKKSHRIDLMLRKELPLTFMGFPTNFTKPNEKNYLVQQMREIKKGPVNHLISFACVRSFWEHYLGFDPSKRIDPIDWLVFPQQALLELTGGEVFHDGLPEKELTATREKFAYYPDPIWRYLYMIQWEKIGSIEAFMGRAGEVGDELGSHVVAAHIAENIMKLCFYVERQYVPYKKWFGTAFSRLHAASDLTYILLDLLHGKDWREREQHLGKAYEVIAHMHNELHITKPIKTETQDFHGRPYKVIHALKIRDQIYDTIDDVWIKQLKYKLGALDQLIDHAIITRTDYFYNELRDDLGKKL